MPSDYKRTTKNHCRLMRKIKKLKKEKEVKDSKANVARKKRYEQTKRNIEEEKVKEIVDKHVLKVKPCEKMDKTLKCPHFSISSALIYEFLNKTFTLKTNIDLLTLVIIDPLEDLQKI